MAITRTAMIDDDGSGTTGTILNNAWKQELYGQIDAALGVVRYAGYAQADGLAGNYDNYAMPTGAANTVWLFNPTAPVSFTGFVAETHLTAHLLVNITSQPILFYNFVQSSPANRVICPGYANYTLATWGSIWMTYFGNLGGWVLHKAT
jgi:hypothetical protein